MFVGMRHRQNQSPVLGLLAFGLMSVIALLALACFPVFAHAEDSSGVQYSDDIPTLPENKNSQAKKQPPAKSSTDNGGASAPTGKSGSMDSRDSTGGSSEDDSSEREGGAAAGSNDGGNGQGSPGSSANGTGKADPQLSGQAEGTPASAGGDGGSSPLVPILIAILVLAAISLAVVMVRQRRQGGPTTPASPKAS